MYYGPTLPFTMNADTHFARITSGNGYDRELALNFFSVHPEHRVIDTLPQRLNDWAPQVRAAAQRAFVAHLRHEWMAQWFRIAINLYGLSSKSRSNHTALLNTFEDFLLAEGNAERVVTDLSSFPLALHGFLYMACASKRPELRDALITLGLRSSHVVVARAALKMVCERSTDEQAWCALRARLAEIRLHALRWIISQRPYLRDEALRLKLHDRSTSVFAVAVFHLKLAHFDFNAWMNDAGSPLETRLRLAQTGAIVLSSATVETLCQHELATVRNRALQLRVKGDRTALDQSLRDALSDPSIRVQRLSRVFLKRGATLRYEDVITRLECDPSLQIFPLMNGLCKYLNGWDHLRVIVRYAAQYEARSKTPADATLYTWMQQRAPHIKSAPSAEQLADIRAHHVERRLGDPMRFMLRSFGVAA
jgi:hypothetical protein